MVVDLMNSFILQAYLTQLEFFLMVYFVAVKHSKLYCLCAFRPDIKVIQSSHLP